MNDFTGRTRLDDRTPPAGTVRTYVVALDTAQYQVRTGLGWREYRHGPGGAVACWPTCVEARWPTPPQHALH